MTLTATVADLDSRRRRIGMTTAELSRVSEVSYLRIYRGTLRDEDAAAVDAALRARERDLLVALAGLTASA